jgi:hypothetical protein
MLVRSILTKKFFRALAGVIIGYCLGFLLLCTPALGAAPQTVSQAPSPSVAEENPNSAIDAQVKLIPKIRRFYGGKKTTEGLWLSFS